MANVFTTLGSALYTKLAAGTALITELGGTAIWDTLAPQDQSLPYLVFFYSGGGDENRSAKRARSLVYTVKAVAESKSKAEAIDAEVDTLLHQQTLTISGWDNWWTARVADVAFVQSAGGVLHWHRGGQYRIRIVDP